MQVNYNRKIETREKPGHGSSLTLHYLIGNKTVCLAEYRLTPDCRFIEIPLPVLAQARAS